MDANTLRNQVRLVVEQKIDLVDHFASGVLYGPPGCPEPPVYQLTAQPIDRIIGTGYHRLTPFEEDKIDMTDMEIDKYLDPDLYGMQADGGKHDKCCGLYDYFDCFDGCQQTSNEFKRVITVLSSKTEQNKSKVRANRIIVNLLQRYLKKHGHDQRQFPNVDQLPEWVDRIDVDHQMWLDTQKAMGIQKKEIKALVISNAIIVVCYFSSIISFLWWYYHG